MDQTSDIEEVFIDCGGPDDVECILLDDSDEDGKEVKVKVDKNKSENSSQEIKSNNKVKDEPPTNNQKHKKSSPKKSQSVQKKIKTESTEIDLPKKSSPKKPQTVQKKIKTESTEIDIPKKSSSKNPQSAQKKVKVESTEIDLPKKSLKIKLKINLKENSITTNENSTTSTEFHCALCFNKYPTKDKLAFHMTRRHRGDSNVCPICKKNISTDGNLKKHIKRHSSTNPRQHLKTPHEMELLKAGKPIYTCPICGKDVKKRYLLQRHMVVHSTLKNYICQVCNKGFANEIRLQNHAIIHTDKYKCKMCGNILASKYSLKKHKEFYCKMNDEIPVETVVKKSKRLRLNCKKCTKIFSKQWKLNYHMLGIHGISLNK